MGVRDDAQVLKVESTPFRYAAAGSSLILAANSTSIFAVTKVHVWVTGANTWRFERRVAGGQAVALIPAAGFAFDYTDRQGYLDVAAWVSRNGSFDVVPIFTLDAGEELWFVRGGAGEILGTIEGVSLSKK